MSSGLGRFGSLRFGIYAASKHAIEGLMKCAALEDAADGLCHVAVAPGMVQTDMLRAAMLGADISGFLDPRAVAAGFVRLVTDVATRGGTLNGSSVDIETWMAAGSDGEAA